MCSLEGEMIGCGWHRLDAENLHVKSVVWSGWEGIEVGYRAGIPFL